MMYIAAKGESMNNKKISNIIIIAILILLTSVYGLVKYFSLKDINKLQINVNNFIDYVDKVSENKAQINWKYVCAIVGVLEDNNFKKVSETDIKNIASKFINDENKLKSLDSVLKELNFNEKEIKRIYKYLDDLKYYGKVPSKLQENSKYIKFIEEIKEGAISNYSKYGILPSITIAQAILETGWGESELASKYNNVFGIKADKSWNGDTITLETKEYFDTMIKDKFRVYKDKNQSIDDHGKFLYENNRYKEYGLFSGNTYLYQTKALQDAGYSTHMDEKGEKIYAKQLIQIIQQYNLQIIDSEVQSKS